MNKTWAGLSVYIGLLAVLALGASSAEAAGSCFHVYDATLFTNKPNLAAQGIQHITLVEPMRWWKGVPDNDDALRDATKTNTLPLLQSQEPVLIDLELPLAGNTPAIAQNQRRYVQVIDWMRAAGYNKPLSFYASLPLRDYWRALQGPGKAPYQAWQRENDALQPIVAKVDALYPSLYTFYQKPDDWVRYAQANIAEARRIGRGRPVYPFLWPQYHDSAGALAHHEIEADYWLRQLRAMRDNADGLVLWGGYDFEHKQRAQWNENAGWWQATRQFLSETHNICPATS
jgi:hypothetical protein